MQPVRANMMAASILLLLLWAAPPSRAASPPVTLAMDKQAVTLANGQVTVRIHKQTGNIISVKYKGLDLINLGRGGYWSLVADSEGEDEERSGSHNRSLDSCVVRIDPARNGGDRAEIACKVSYQGKGAEVPLDMEVRYALGRDDPGIFVSCILEHRATYPAVKLGQGRFALRLNPDIFDFYTVDADRRRVMATGYDVKHGTVLNVKEALRLTTGVRQGEVEHKYDYSAMLAQLPAYGWSSTKSHVGLWMINPSAEYLNGGPTHVDTTGHVEAILLTHMQGGHYGGGAILLGKGESWKKFFGPFFIYCNAGPDHDVMWHDALSRAATEQRAWPYAWVADQDYPPPAARGSLTGRIKLDDPRPPAAASNIWVGLAAAPYAPPCRTVR
jgi:rhamnogalacturonan endolyase